MLRIGLTLIRQEECLNIGFWLKKTGSYLMNAPSI